MAHYRSVALRILGLDDNATDEEIRTAYKRLSGKWEGTSGKPGPVICCVHAAAWGPGELSASGGSSCKSADGSRLRCCGGTSDDACGVACDVGTSCQSPQADSGGDAEDGGTPSGPFAPGRMDFAAFVEMYMNGGCNISNPTDSEGIMALRPDSADADVLNGNGARREWHVGNGKQLPQDEMDSSTSHAHKDSSGRDQPVPLLLRQDPDVHMSSDDAHQHQQQRQQQQQQGGPGAAQHQPPCSGVLVADSAVELSVACPHMVLLAEPEGGELGREAAPGAAPRHDYEEADLATEVVEAKKLELQFMLPSPPPPQQQQQQQQGVVAADEGLEVAVQSVHPPKGQQEESQLEALAIQPQHEFEQVADPPIQAARVDQAGLDTRAEITSQQQATEAGVQEPHQRHRQEEEQAEQQQIEGDLGVPLPLHIEQHLPREEQGDTMPAQGSAAAGDHEDEAPVEQQEEQQEEQQQEQQREEQQDQEQEQQQDREQEQQQEQGHEQEQEQEQVQPPLAVTGLEHEPLLEGDAPQAAPEYSLSNALLPQLLGQETCQEQQAESGLSGQAATHPLDGSATAATDMDAAIGPGAGPAAASGGEPASPLAAAVNVDFALVAEPAALPDAEAASSSGAEAAVQAGADAAAWDPLAAALGDVIKMSAHFSWADEVEACEADASGAEDDAVVPPGCAWAGDDAEEEGAAEEGAAAGPEQAPERRDEPGEEMGEWRRAQLMNYRLMQQEHHPQQQQPGSSDHGFYDLGLHHHHQAQHQCQRPDGRMEWRSRWRPEPEPAPQHDHAPPPHSQQSFASGSGTAAMPHAPQDVGGSSSAGSSSDGDDDFYDTYDDGASDGGEASGGADARGRKKPTKHQLRVQRRHQLQQEAETALAAAATEAATREEEQRKLMEELRLLVESDEPEELDAAAFAAMTLPQQMAALMAQYESKGAHRPRPCYAPGGAPVPLPLYLSLYDPMQDSYMARWLRHRDPARHAVYAAAQRRLLVTLAERSKAAEAAWAAAAEKAAARQAAQQSVLQAAHAEVQAKAQQVQQQAQAVAHQQAQLIAQQQALKQQQAQQIATQQALAQQQAQLATQQHSQLMAQQQAQTATQQQALQVQQVQAIARQNAVFAQQPVQLNLQQHRHLLIVQQPAQMPSPRHGQVLTQQQAQQLSLQQQNQQQMLAVQQQMLAAQQQMQLAVQQQGRAAVQLAAQTSQGQTVMVVQASPHMQQAQIRPMVVQRVAAAGYGGGSPHAPDVASPAGYVPLARGQVVARGQVAAQGQMVAQAPDPQAHPSGSHMQAAASQLSGSGGSGLTWQQEVALDEERQQRALQQQQQQQAGGLPAGLGFGAEGDLHRSVSAGSAGAGAGAGVHRPKYVYPCKFWARGRCTRGNLCEFRHDGPQELAAAAPFQQQQPQQRAQHSAPRPLTPAALAQHLWDGDQDEQLDVQLLQQLHRLHVVQQQQQQPQDGGDGAATATPAEEQVT